MRPKAVCYCAHITELDTKTRVVLLQHPRERDVGIGTARIAHLSLKNSALRVGVDFADDAIVRDAIASNAYLLFPGENAIDIDEAKLDGPITLVVVDGTWWQARSLWKRNPVLASLPQIRFTPKQLSNYRIRKEPADHCVATIEALAHVLGKLEGDAEKFEALLAPFRTMVDTQLEYAKSVRGAQTRHAKFAARPRKNPRLPVVLSAAPESIVCVHGEVNAWAQKRADGNRAEVIHWLASRPHTGERFECVLKPRAEIAPMTTSYTGVPREAMEQGVSVEEFERRFRAFLREGDVLASWGPYPLDVITKDGVSLNNEIFDVRAVACGYLRKSPGAINEFVDSMNIDSETPWGIGRGGKRISALTTVTRYLISEAAIRAVKKAAKQN